MGVETRHDKRYAVVILLERKLELMLKGVNARFRKTSDIVLNELDKTFGVVPYIENHVASIPHIVLGTASFELHKTADTFGRRTLRKAETAILKQKRRFITIGAYEIKSSGYLYMSVWRSPLLHELQKVVEENFLEHGEDTFDSNLGIRSIYDWLANPVILGAYQPHIVVANKVKKLHKDPGIEGEYFFMRAVSLVRVGSHQTIAEIVASKPFATTEPPSFL